MRRRELKDYARRQAIGPDLAGSVGALARGLVLVQVL